MSTWLEITELVGKVFSSVEGAIDGDELVFTVDDTERYRFYHDQSCCEYVVIEDIVGDLEYLVGSPLIMAEEVNDVNLPPLDENAESHTWTFYKFATAKGYVTVRWYGSSNGYYSESVDFERVC